MVPVSRGIEHEADVLIRQVDGRLATLRAGCDAAGCDEADVAAAAEMADNLRSLVMLTRDASAADRARVRAAVHLFVGLGGSRERWRQRSLHEDLRMINDMLIDLDRTDLVVTDRTPACARAVEHPEHRRRCPLLTRAA